MKINRYNCSGFRSHSQLIAPSRKLLKMNSSELRETLINIEGEIASAGERLAAADAAYKATIRDHISSGATSPLPSQPSELNEVRDALSRLALAREATREMIAAAVEREKLEHDETARTELRALIVRLGTEARQADQTAASLIGHLRALARLGREVNTLLFQRMGREPLLYGPSQTSVSKISGAIANATRPDAPALEPFAETAVRQFSAEALRVAGG